MFTPIAKVETCSLHPRKTTAMENDLYANVVVPCVPQQTGSKTTYITTYAIQIWGIYQICQMANNTFFIIVLNPKPDGHKQKMTCMVLISCFHIHVVSRTNFIVSLICTYNIILQSWAYMYFNNIYRMYIINPQWHIDSKFDAIAAIATFAPGCKVGANLFFHPGRRYIRCTSASTVSKGLFIWRQVIRQSELLSNDETRLL